MISRRHRDRKRLTIIIYNNNNWTSMRNQQPWRRWRLLSGFDPSTKGTFLLLTSIHLIDPTSKQIQFCLRLSFWYKFAKFIYWHCLNSMTSLFSKKINDWMLSLSFRELDMNAKMIVQMDGKRTRIYNTKVDTVIESFDTTLHKAYWRSSYTTHGCWILRV